MGVPLPLSLLTTKNKKIMLITNETKIRFVRMLAKKQIIVIQCKKSANSKSYNFKFIGADDYAKYDFTPMIADTLGLPISQDIHYCCVKGIDAAEIGRLTIEKLAKDGIIKEETSGHDLYEQVRHLLTTFYL